ncbi:MAG: DUF4136 domain-containing protein [Psychromonas sp.]|nr:DUF4136 domain-containing protein [Psychromonas sp.]
MKKLFILCLSLIFLNSCTTKPAKHQSHAKLQRETIVSSGDPAKVLPAFTTFAWSDEYSKVLSTENTKYQLRINKHIKKQIIQYLKTKGYVYQPDPIQADVVIGFLFALNNEVADANIQAKFGLLPGVSNRGVNKNKYAKGTFLLVVLDNKLSTVYWRSAMQGFVNMDKDIENMQGDRFQFILNLMMGKFPLAGQ